MSDQQTEEEEEEKESAKAMECASDEHESTSSIG